jgi:hypothetical protein
MQIMITNPKLTCQIITTGIIAYVLFHILAASMIYYHTLLSHERQHRITELSSQVRPLQQAIGLTKNKTTQTMSYEEFHSEYYDPYDLYI